MFICEECGEVFEDPAVLNTRESVDGFYTESSAMVCPYCENAYIYEANKCECGNWKPKRFSLCKDCEKEVKEKLQEMWEDFSENQKCFFNSLLEGNSIYDIVREEEENDSM